VIPRIAPAQMRASTRMLVPDGSPARGTTAENNRRSQPSGNRVNPTQLHDDPQSKESTWGHVLRPYIERRIKIAAVETIDRR